MDTRYGSNFYNLNTNDTRKYNKWFGVWIKPVIFYDSLALDSKKNVITPYLPVKISCEMDSGKTRQRNINIEPVFIKSKL